MLRMITQTTYRIWQIGFRRGSITLLVTGRTFRTQVEGALTPVEGDCQYVLLNVTVPPQPVMGSVLKRQFYFSFQNITAKMEFLPTKNHCETYSPNIYIFLSGSSSMRRFKFKCLKNG
jgi:hypothetical protein